MNPNAAISMKSDVGDIAVTGTIAFEFGYIAGSAVTATVTHRPSIMRQIFKGELK